MISTFRYRGPDQLLARRRGSRNVTPSPLPPYTATGAMMVNGSVSGRKTGSAFTAECERSIATGRLPSYTVATHLLSARLSFQRIGSIQRCHCRIALKHRCPTLLLCRFPAILRHYHAQTCRAWVHPNLPATVLSNPQMRNPMSQHSPILQQVLRL